MRYDGKFVLVTGAAAGIGRATAAAFAGEGATVIVADIDGAEAGRAAAEITNGGGSATARQADFSDPDAVTALFRAIDESLGGLDVAVNCAEIEEDEAPFEQIGLDCFRRTMRANVEGLFLCMQAEIRLMKRQGHGAIVNVASQMAHEGMPNRAAYGASKHAVWALTKTAALEVARANIQINAISPGPVETRRTARRFAERPEERAAVLDSVPTGRLLQADDVARGILFLASPDAAQFLGQTLRLDGGAAGVQPSTLWHYPRRAALEPART